MKANLTWKIVYKDGRTEMKRLATGFIVDHADTIKGGGGMLEGGGSFQIQHPEQIAYIDETPDGHLTKRYPRNQG